MSGLKNFLIALAIGLVIFSLLAYVVIKVFFLNEQAHEKKTDIQTNLAMALEKFSSENNDLNNQEITDDKVSEDKYNGESFAIAYGIISEDNSKLLNIVVVKTDEENEKVIYLPFPAYMSMKYSVTGNYGEKYEVSTTLGDMFGAYGAEYVKDKLSALTGLNIDNFLFLSKEGVKSCVNSVGGVSFTVPNDVIKTVINDSGENDFVTLLSGGTKEFNGEEAAIALCDSEYIGNKEQFLKMHIDFLKGFFDKLLNNNSIQTIEKTITKAINNSRTDYSISEFEKNSELIVASLKFEQVVCFFPENIVEISGEAVYGMLLDNYDEFK